jgi:hypothetical protein
LLGTGGTRKDAPETLMLIGALGTDGVVHVRTWSGDDWSAPPRVRAERASDLLAWLEAESAKGRRMNQPLSGLRLWLRGQGGAPR